jgi:hypothetical protein
MRRPLRAIAILLCFGLAGAELLGARPGAAAGIRPFHDRLPACGQSLQRRLHVVPRQWSFQRHAPAVHRLPQRRHCPWAAQHAWTDHRQLRGVPYHRDLGAGALQSQPNHWGLCQLPQRRPCARQTPNPPRYRGALRDLPQEHHANAGDVHIALGKQVRPRQLR